MKVYYRNGRLLFKLQLGEDMARLIPSHSIPDLEQARGTHVWSCSASLINAAFLVKKYPEAFKGDALTEGWVSKQLVLGKRIKELQDGVKNGSRPIVLPDCIDYVLNPYQHQKEALAFTLNVDRCALWLEMGLGKTYTSITSAKLRNKLNGVNKVLCIVPRSLMYQWRTEIHRFSPGSPVIYVDGTPKNKLKAMQSIPKDVLSFTLVTYESIDSLLSNLLSVAFDMVILDESTKVKNPKAQRTKNTVMLCKGIPYAIELTGMAYVNNPLDLFSQFMVIDTSIFGKSQWDFSNRYIKYQNAVFGRYPIGFKNLDELKNRSYFAAFSRTKEQCLDLPKKVHQFRTMPMYQDQYEWYVSLVDQINSTEIKDDLPVTVDYVVSLLEKLQQITSGFVKADNGEYIWFDSPKYGEARSIVRENPDVFLVWAKHTYTINKLRGIFSSIPDIRVEVLNRKSTPEQRAHIKDEFKAGKIKVLILQIQSECRGNDFTCKNNSVSSIFFENTPSIEERMQAEDRQHRIGMTGTAVYIDLLCEGTYDEGIMQLLKNKEKLSTYIREQKINMLLGKGGSFVPKKTKSTKVPKKPAEVRKEVDDYAALYSQRPEGMDT